MNRYDGLTNIWLNLKDLSRFPHNPEDYIAINHLKCNKGYCLVSRSMIIKNINFNYCMNLDLDKISRDNVHLLKVGQIILCKMSSWPDYVPGQIVYIHKKIKNESWFYDEIQNIFMDTYDNNILNISFPSCPESEIYLGWHSNNEILKNRSILTYQNILSMNNNTSLLNTSLKKSYRNKSNFKIAPFINEDSDDEEIIEDVLNTLINNIIEKNQQNSIIHSGLFDKKDTYKNEVLRYKIHWLKIKNSFDISVSSKSCNISHNTTSGKFLSNVAIINPFQINEIIKIQCKNNHGLKKLHKKQYHVENKEKYLEPQELKFLKKMPQPIFLFNEDMLYTYTGLLCNAAKRYLFSINKIDIK